MSKLQLVKELHRSARKNFVRRKTVVRGIELFIYLFIGRNVILQRLYL